MNVLLAKIFVTINFNPVYSRSFTQRQQADDPYTHPLRERLFEAIQPTNVEKLRSAPAPSQKMSHTEEIGSI